MYEHLRNPIILGILSAVLIYAYLYWSQKNKEKDMDNIKKKPVSIIIPGVIGLVVWFLASSFLSTETTPVIAGESGPSIEGCSEISEMSVPEESYHLIGKNKVRLPDDVFIDVANF